MDNLDAYEKIIKYSQEKYKYVVFKKIDDDVWEDEVWSLEETEESAKETVKRVTAAYDDPEWQFYYRSIGR